MGKDKKKKNVIRREVKSKENNIRDHSLGNLLHMMDQVCQKYIDKAVEGGETVDFSLLNDEEEEREIIAKEQDRKPTLERGGRQVKNEFNENEPATKYNDNGVTFINKKSTVVKKKVFISRIPKFDRENKMENKLIENTPDTKVNENEDVFYEKKAKVISGKEYTSRIPSLDRGNLTNNVYGFGTRIPLLDSLNIVRNSPSSKHNNSRISVQSCKRKLSEDDINNKKKKEKLSKEISTSSTCRRSSKRNSSVTDYKYTFVRQRKGSIDQKRLKLGESVTIPNFKPVSVDDKLKSKRKL